MRKFLLCLALGFLGITSTASAAPPPWGDNGYYGQTLSAEFFDSYPIGPSQYMCLQHGNSGSWIVQSPGASIADHSLDVWTRTPGTPTYVTGRYCGPQDVPEGAETTFFVRFSQFAGWAVVGIGNDADGTFWPGVDFWVDDHGKVYVPRPSFTSATFLQVGTIVANHWYYVGMRVNPATQTGILGIYEPATLTPVVEFRSTLAATWGNSGAANARCVYASPGNNSNQDIYLDWIKPGHLVH